MDEFAKYLSLAAAGCFVCSAAFLFGQLSGIGHIELVWYLTFSDFVNYAPSTLLAWGIWLAGWTINDATLRSAFRRVGTTDPTKQLRNLKIALAFFSIVIVLIGLALFFQILSWRTLATIGSVSVVLIALNQRAQGPIATAYGQFAADSFDSFLTLILVAVVAGYTLGANTNTHSTYTVCTDNHVRSANFVLPLDRGLVLLEQSGFRIVPWDNIKSVYGGPTVSLPTKRIPLFPYPVPPDFCATNSH